MPAGHVTFEAVLSVAPKTAVLALKYGVRFVVVARDQVALQRRLGCKSAFAILVTATQHLGRNVRALVANQMRLLYKGCIAGVTCILACRTLPVNGHNVPVQAAACEKRFFAFRALNRRILVIFHFVQAFDDTATMSRASIVPTEYELLHGSQPDQPFLTCAKGKVYQARGNPETQLYEIGVYSIDAGETRWLEKCHIKALQGYYMHYGDALLAVVDVDGENDSQTVCRVFDVVEDKQVYKCVIGGEKHVNFNGTLGPNALYYILDNRYLHMVNLTSKARVTFDMIKCFPEPSPEDVKEARNCVLDMLYENNLVILTTHSLITADVDFGDKDCVLPMPMLCNYNLPSPARMDLEPDVDFSGKKCKKLTQRNHPYGICVLNDTFVVMCSHNVILLFKNSSVLVVPVKDVCDVMAKPDVPDIIYMLDTRGDVHRIGIKPQSQLLYTQKRNDGLLYGVNRAFNRRKLLFWHDKKQRLGIVREHSKIELLP